MSQDTPLPVSGRQSNLLFGGILLFLLIASITLYSGNISGRWFAVSGLAEASERLRELPMTLGNWEAKENRELTAEETTALKIAGNYLYRIYEHKLTGDSVSFILMVGPPGRLGVHTPEKCFGGQDYVKDEQRQVADFPIEQVADGQSLDGRARTDRLWKVMFRNAVQPNLAIVFYYGLNAGDGWRASEHPRSEFQGHRFIYKLQVQSYASADPEEGESDAVAEFFKEALPLIRQSVEHSTARLPEYTGDH
ncbi:MAG TPA: hypothetical protein DEB39_05615 [Planctomycetaceae bacterium]|nr:hypothetical protein [Planctomycetaceae bacterium]